MRNVFIAVCLVLCTTLQSFAVTASVDDVIIETTAYSWHGDTIIQGEFYAFAPDGARIVSTYKAQPGYFMPVEAEWQLKNDISAYPLLKTSNKLHTAVYNMGLDEMVNAVEPDTTLRTGKEWSGVWTRDVSYSIILSMAQMQPEASMISLRKKITPDGRIVQDTGSGGAWPVSTDRMIWIVAAWEVYKATGNIDWIKEIFPVVEKSLSDDKAGVYSSTGLIKGETSFIDWREQSYPRWMQSADIFSSEALGTSVLHAQALKVASEMALLLGKKELAQYYSDTAQEIAKAVNDELWMDEKGYYAMYKYGRGNNILNPRAETLGSSLAILFDVADREKAMRITESMPVTPFGAPVFYPQISDMPPYHNNALWPFVASYWALANAKAGNEEGLLEAIGSVFRPAALFATNKENLVIDNGDIATELNSSNMLWSLSGNLAITNRILFGINLEKDGILFQPVIPRALDDERKLINYPYRGKSIDIDITGWGDSIASISLNGKKLKDSFVSEKELKQKNSIEIRMACEPFKQMKVNRVMNHKAPLTPIAWFEENDSVLRWNPIEYINHYIVIRDGERIAETRQTSFNASYPGEYMVIGVDDSGTESFASEPRSNLKRLVFQIPDEGTRMVSTEISYSPAEEIAGYHGSGYVETDHVSGNISVPVEVPATGYYSLSLRYANGNGPVNTENKCAVRSVYVNGEKAGIVVMPHRGRANWNDWGMSNYVKLYLKQGENQIDIRFDATDENMNILTNHALIDEVVLTELN